MRYFIKIILILILLIVFVIIQKALTISIGTDQSRVGGPIGLILIIGFLAAIRAIWRYNPEKKDPDSKDPHSLDKR